MIFSYSTRALAGLFFLVLVSSATGQSAIDTEQPFASNSAGTVPQGSMQFEVGGWLQWETPEGAQVEEFSYAVPVGVIRYGWRERLEVRVGARFTESLGQAEQAHGGIKWNIVPQMDGFRAAADFRSEAS